jgi:hypothetical protein
MLFHQQQKAGIDHLVYISAALFYTLPNDALQHLPQLQSPNHQEGLASYKV